MIVSVVATTRRIAVIVDVDSASPGVIMPESDKLDDMYQRIFDAVLDRIGTVNKRHIQKLMSTVHGWKLGMLLQEEGLQEVTLRYEVDSHKRHGMTMELVEVEEKPNYAKA